MPHRFRSMVRLLLLVAPLTVAAGGEVPLAWSGPAYLNSKGERVELRLATDRVRVKPAQGSIQALLGRAEIGTQEDRRPGRNGMLTLRLAPAHQGRGDKVVRRLRQDGLIEGAGLVFKLPDGSRTFALDGQVILRLAAPTRHAPLALLAGAGLQLVRKMDAEGRTWLARAADAGEALVACGRAARRQEVVWVLPDFIVPVELSHRPNDPFYDHQWYLHQESGAHIHAQAAWDITRGDPRVVVAVIDSGVDTDHPDFDPARILEGYSSLTGDSDQTPRDNTYDAHGTNAAGLALAVGDNGEGMSGVCPQCSLMPIKMMDGLTQESELSNAYLALNYATEHGAWVLSNSWSIDEAYTGEIDMQPYYDAVRNAVDKGRGGLGAVVVFASGNGNANNGTADAIGEHELQNMPEVMAVGGSGIDDRRVSYSNFGPNLSVMAPAGAFYPWEFGMFTTDTVDARGFSREGFLWIWVGQQDQKTSHVEADTTGNYTQYFTGTSAACPIAAGVVALVFAVRPELTGAQARLIVEQTADKVGDVDYGEDGHHDRYGNGRVNAARAVRAAQLGFDLQAGVLCIADINCQSGSCTRRSGDLYGWCLEGCTTDEDCASGRACVPIVAQTTGCLPACGDHVDCLNDSLCLHGGCRPLPCQTGADCPSGAACSPEGLDTFCEPVCGSQDECQPSEVCLTASGGDTCQVIACSKDKPCPTWGVCSPQGHCHPYRQIRGCGPMLTTAASDERPDDTLIWIVLLLLLRWRARAEPKAS